MGAGGWGTTLAILLAARGPVTLLARAADAAEHLGAERVNARHLPGVPLPGDVQPTADAAALADAVDLIVIAVPSRHVRETARRIAPHVRPGTPVLSVAKGLEAGSLLRMSEVIAAELPGSAGRVAALSGPNLAPEIARGLPASSVVGCPDVAVAAVIAAQLGSRMFRLYTTRTSWAWSWRAPSRTSSRSPRAPPTSWASATVVRPPS